MKKSLLTLAVAAGMVASGAAFAEVKTYGHAQVELGIWGGDVEGMSVSDAARGRIGFKAAEDIGGGMKALSKAEFKVDFADGDSNAACSNAACTSTQGISLQKREMMVGLKGGFGQVEAGRLKSAYKYFGGVKYDPFVATVLEARGRGGMTGKVGKGNAYGHNSFISDSIGYQNKMGAISFRVTYDFDDGGPAATATGANGMTAGFKFKTKQFEVIAAIANDGENAEYSATKIGGQFKVSKALKISAQFEDGEKGATTYENLWINADFKLGGGKVVNAAFGSDGGTADQDMLRVALTNKFSKTSKVWVGYSSSNTTATDTNVIAVGMQNRF